MCGRKHSPVRAETAPASARVCERRHSSRLPPVASLDLAIVGGGGGGAQRPSLGRHRPEERVEPNPIVGQASWGVAETDAVLDRDSPKRRSRPKFGRHRWKWAALLDMTPIGDEPAPKPNRRWAWESRPWRRFAPRSRKPRRCYAWARQCPGSRRDVEVIVAQGRVGQLQARLEARHPLRTRLARGDE